MAGEVMKITRWMCVCLCGLAVAMEMGMATTLLSRYFSIPLSSFYHSFSLLLSHHPLNPHPSRAHPPHRISPSKPYTHLPSTTTSSPNLLAASTLPSTSPRHLATTPHPDQQGHGRDSAPWIADEGAADEGAEVQNGTCRLCMGTGACEGERRPFGGTREDGAVVRSLGVAARGRKTGRRDRARLACHPCT